MGDNAVGTKTRIQVAVDQGSSHMDCAAGPALTKPKQGFGGRINYEINNPSTPSSGDGGESTNTKGTVQITRGCSDGPSCTATLAESSCMVEFLQPGDFVVRAEYEGDDNFEPAFSEALIVGVTSVTAIPMPHTAWILGLLLIGLTMAKLRRG